MEAGAAREVNNLNGIQAFRAEDCSRLCLNLAVAVLSVPYSLDSGKNLRRCEEPGVRTVSGRARLRREHKPLMST